ncbi:MAG: hypothetical protein M3014_05360 [Chloroflexota bacterium]|nr:hypothetical protein [Chloroflexota bacterium]
MAQIVEANAEGALYLAPELLAGLLGELGNQPYTRYLLEAQEGNLVLTRLEHDQPFWMRTTGQERAHLPQLGYEPQGWSRLTN